MSQYKYPLLCSEVTDGAIAAHIIGINREFVGNDIKEVKEHVKRWLTEQLVDSWGYEPELEEVSLRNTSLKLRASYESDRGVYPVNHQIKVPIVAVYGQNPEYGFSKCYLPFLNRAFYYHDEAQLKTLIEYFVRESLEGREPALIHRHLNIPQVWLDSITIRVPKSQSEEHTVFSETLLDEIKQFAEPLPMKRSTRRNFSLFPETAWEFGEQVEDLSTRLIERDSHLLIVGDKGVGKSVLIMDAIKRASRLAGSFKHREALTVWRTQAQRLTANAKYLGEWQQHVEGLIENLTLVNGVLWISDLINLFELGGEGVEDSVAAFLFPMMKEGKLRLITELSSHEYDAALQIYPAFIGQFQVIRIAELTEASIFRIIKQLRHYSEQNFNIQISESSTTLSHRLLKRFAPLEKFPGKMVSFLTECVRDAQKQKSPHINDEAIINNFVRRSGLPKIMIQDQILLKPEKVSQYFHQRVLFQEDAINALVQTVLVFKAGLNDPNKPIATLLFTGPTGVGKTAAAKALANYFFGAGQQKNPLFQIDMSEFQYPHQIGRLIGYDKNNVGKLVEHVRNRPFSVILLDEIEKAHSAIFDVLPNVFDEGILLDRFGRVTDFRNSILIMTSNLGASLSGQIGFAGDDTGGADLSAVKQHFRPEFINRIDQIVQFQSLDKAAIHDIAKKELTELNQREGITARKCQLEFEESVIEHIAQVGFHAKFGARPLQRAIEQNIVNEISTWLLSKPEISNATLVIGFRAGKISIRRGKSKARQPE